MNEDVILVLGLSGAGKSVAMRALDDWGYHCVANLPIGLLPALLQWRQVQGIARLALTIDVRSSADVATCLQHLQTMDNVRALFLSAQPEVLLRRYNESRRGHPLQAVLSQQQATVVDLPQCIAQESNILSPFRDIACGVDTSGLLPNQLSAWVQDFAGQAQASLLLTFESFAFKQGTPNTADLVFDVRCLPNPHYEPHLRPLTGRDQPVVQWLSAQEAVQQLLSDITGFLQKWLPRYAQQSRRYMTVAIGCTGGQHRSVYVAEALAQQFCTQGSVCLRHRAQVGFYTS